MTEPLPPSARRARRHHRRRVRGAAEQVVARDEDGLARLEGDVGQAAPGAGGGAASWRREEAANRSSSVMRQIPVETSPAGIVSADETQAESASP